MATISFVRLASASLLETLWIFACSSVRVALYVGYLVQTMSWAIKVVQWIARAIVCCMTRFLFSSEYFSFRCIGFHFMMVIEGIHSASWSTFFTSNLFILWNLSYAFVWFRASLWCRHMVRAGVWVEVVAV